MVSMLLALRCPGSVRVMQATLHRPSVSTLRILIADNAGLSHPLPRRVHPAPRSGLCAILASALQGQVGLNLGLVRITGLLGVALGIGRGVDSLSPGVRPRSWSTIRR